MPTQLPDEIHNQIVLLSKQGDDLAQKGDLEAAKERYIAALRLLPEDHIQWNAATWLYVALGDAHFRTGAFDKAHKCFINAIQCPDGLGNPYIHLRLGQVNFESKNLGRAADELARAYMGGGMEIFMEDDPKYLEFLETRITV
ncbi:hypothetical protein EJO68_12890 [Variovorax atrisoli]|uniref:tetratricopeptide repeat protein n=1 Tax=Variovorax atrisoli TaxID=3394203 RepID=UPI000F7EA29C|nr:tetratricopeptide repeat protein [Variovorax sp. 369]RTD94648.1 hypothetical protein EJO68_12890 [Variovorax sp. 369]